MGYFANGTEGEWYEAKICSRCTHHTYHEDGYVECAVWNLHLDHNGADEDSPVGQVLNELIPLSSVPGYNDLCAMWTPSEPQYAGHGDDYKAWLKQKGQK